MTDEAKALDLSPANIAKQVEGLLAHAEERQMKGWTTSAHNLRVAADLIETQAREIERLSYALGCIANEDWKDMTVELARDTARAALGDSHDQ